MVYNEELSDLYIKRSSAWERGDTLEISEKDLRKS